MKNLPRNNARPSKGFSLIELLTAIVIIGILAVMAISIFSLTGEKSRDAKRKIDLDTLKKALEQFKADTKTSAYYPKEANGTNCNTDTTFCIPKQALIYTESPSYTYLKKIPKDPKTQKDYYYNASRSNDSECDDPSPRTDFTPANSSDCTKFILVACLENPSDPKRDQTLNTAACTSGWKGSSYTVRNN